MSELFDLNSDPGEIRNRYAEPAQRDRMHRLPDQVHAWQEQHTDKLPLAV